MIEAKRDPRDAWSSAAEFEAAYEAWLCARPEAFPLRRGTDFVRAEGVPVALFLPPWFVETLCRWAEVWRCTPETVLLHLADHAALPLIDSAPGAVVLKALAGDETPMPDFLDALLKRARADARNWLQSQSSERPYGRFGSASYD